MTVTPHAPFDSGENLFALMVAREGRRASVPHEGRLGIVWCVRNRCAMSPVQGFKPTPDEEILRPWQFSSFNHDPDPQGNGNWYPVMPAANGQFPSDLEERLANHSVWQECLRAVREGMDPANTVPPAAFYRVVFYWSLPLTEAPKAWGPTLEASCIGGLHFCVIDQIVSLT